MPNGLVYGSSELVRRLRRLISTRSSPHWRAARSINRSITNITSGRPELRYGRVGVVLLVTQRARKQAAGMR